MSINAKFRKSWKISTLVEWQNLTRRRFIRVRVTAVAWMKRGKEKKSSEISLKISRVGDFKSFFKFIKTTNQIKIVKSGANLIRNSSIRLLKLKTKKRFRFFTLRILFVEPNNRNLKGKKLVCVRKTLQARAAQNFCFCFDATLWKLQGNFFVYCLKTGKILKAAAFKYSKYLWLLFDFNFQLSKLFMSPCNRSERWKLKLKFINGSRMATMVGFSKACVAQEFFSFLKFCN